MRCAAALFLGLGLAVVAVTSAAAAEGPTRLEYVTRLEAICKPGSLATQRAIRGVKGDVRSENLRRAAPKVARARRIFAGTVGRIAPVPRPIDDRTTLARWMAALHREDRALGHIVQALREDDVARFERVWADFLHEGASANNIVVSFGFNYCAFRSSRFE
jgi:hypothetical protein